MSANLLPVANLLADLEAIVGSTHLLTGQTEREFYSMDVYNQGQVPLAVVRPGSVEELQAVVRGATSAGVAVVPRGGGASYTDGYLPTRSHSIMLDTGRLNRIVELNEQDMYVTVEPGMTWAELWQTLKAKGLRTTFWGPFSGIKATVGGSMSQNSASLGSGNYGVSADAVLALKLCWPAACFSRPVPGPPPMGHRFSLVRPGPDGTLYRRRRGLGGESADHPQTYQESAVFWGGVFRF